MVFRFVRVGKGEYMKIVVFIIIGLLLIRLYFLIKRIVNNKLIKRLTDKISIVERIVWIFFGFNTLAILTLLFVLLSSFNR